MATVLSANGRSFNVISNPSISELAQLGGLVRFTADNTTRTVHAWDFNSGRHADVSIGLKLADTFDSPDFLGGAAEKGVDGGYEMVGSDFLQSFVGRITSDQRSFLIELLNRQWEWVDEYIRVTGALNRFRHGLGL